MANNHLNRLLRLARRTGDRLIVTDERGSEEPLVILPLDEYEALIDGAFGPGEIAVEAGEWGMGGQGGVTTSGVHLEDIQVEEAVIVGEEGDGANVFLNDETEAPEEADIDEEALKSLWEPKETEENKGKVKEVASEKGKKPLDGEEGFYLEAID